MWSPVYDTFFNSGIFLHARKKVFQETHLHNKQKILFVGVGTGADFEQINHADLDITAIDFSPNMLKKAKDKYKESTIQFLEMDAQNMSFENHSFDVVIASLLLSVVPDAEKCFQEMARVLKPEGMIILFDKFTNEKRLSWPKRLLRPLIKFFGTDIGLSFEGLFNGHHKEFRIEEDKAVMLGGMYRKITIRKGN